MSTVAPTSPPLTRAAWRRRRFREELLIRASLAVVILFFNELSGLYGDAVGANPVTRAAGLGELLINGPYYLAARHGRWARGQAYFRMLMDIGFVTLGLYGAGGLAAAPSLGVYAIIIVYTGIMFSSAACLSATAVAVACFLTMALAQERGWLPAASASAPAAWSPAAFNLLVLAIVGGLTAVLSEAYRRSRQLARASRDRFRALAESASDAIVSADSAGRIVSWNRGAALMFGHTEVEVLGQPLTMLMPERYAEAHLRGLAQAGSSEEARVVGRTLEVAGLRKDGSEFPAELSLSSWRAEDGMFFSGIIRDITERRRIEEQLRQSQKLEAIGSLAGGIAHDFNNLLTVIQGRSEIVHRRLRAEDPIRHDVGLISETATRAAQLTRQLLAFGRKQVLQPQVVDLNVVVTNMGEMLRRLIGEHIALVTLPASEPARIKADPSQIEQVILNFAVNARDAMPEGGRLIVEVKREEVDSAYAGSHVDLKPGPYVVLSVTDTGHGMDAATRAKIFEPFFTTKEPGRGTGLGLATVYGIVKQSGGHIWVYSEPGRGTTFKVQLPRLESAEETPAPEQPEVPAPRGWETVLLVEDDDDVRAVALQALSEAGYMVLEAQDGKAALDLAERHDAPLHLLLTDVVMPGKTGPALAERLVQLRQDVKVLFTSGHTASLLADQDLAHGFGFLEKPYTPSLLVRRVRQVLDGTG